ncbi:restriction endonuclease subunit S [Nitratidesulfovibrio vulgaris]|uniref:Restriction modification system DNA specificity domain n=1 Tax=Nitratidesulfovibrio vulgaris (strain DP4) TaxID=391774 RepID=A0A0H3A5Z8_NITV4|nr:restriction endonuclease subunit S [Nitratidesulfovibrio vulgaris]ABM27875.1 restriction modification system DNA specificity domain [Nitratidesulfovibrio vulgaris DP4]
MALSYKPIEIVKEGKNPLLGKADHWKRVYVSEIAMVQNGFAFKSKFFSRDEGIPLIRIRDILSAETEHKYFGQFDKEYLVHNGDLLIGMDGDFVAAYWPGKEGLLNQRVCRIVIESENYDKKFFFLALQPYLDAIHEKTSSVTVKHLSSKTVNEIPLPLPPLNEQNRIVAKIEELFSELDAGVENLTKAKEQLGVYRQSLLKHAFEGKLTEAWRKRNADKLESGEALLKRVKKEREEYFKKQLEQWEKDVAQWEADGKPGKKPTQPKKPKKLAPISEEELKELPELPEGWVWARLGNLIDPPAYGTSRKSDYNIDGTGVLRIPNIVDGKIDSSDLKYTAFSPGEEEQYRLKAGDLLTIRSNGSVSLVGQCALIEDDDTRYVYAGYLIRLRTIGLLVSKFLLYCLSSLRLRNQIESKAKSTSGVNNINSQELSSLIVPLCSQLEQNEVSKLLADSLSTAGEQTSMIEIQLEHIRILKQSILDKAFSGTLISQDPNDEPASKLLERIKQERKSAPNPKRTRKTKTKRIAMADLKEVLATAKDWVSAQDAFRQCGVGDGAPTDEVEKLYGELKQELDQKTIEVERRGDEDWLRLAAEG